MEGSESSDVSVQPIEIVISFFHPKIFPMYPRLKSVFDEAVVPYMENTCLLLYNALSKLDKGVSEDGFRYICEGLGLPKDAVDLLCSTFKRYMSLTGDDYTSLAERTRYYGLHKAFGKAIESYNYSRNVDKFIDVITNYGMISAGGKFSDPQMFESCQFADIDLEKLEDSISQTKIKSSLEVVNRSTDGGYYRRQMVVIAAPPKCGKSMTAMQETVTFLRQDLHVVYAAFGDLSKADFGCRMASMINHRPMQYTMRHISSEIKMAMNRLPQWKNNLVFHLLTPDQFTAQEYVEYLHSTLSPDNVKTLHQWADVIVIDYDSNIASKYDDNLYKKGEEIYQQLYQLVVPDKLVLLLSQTSKLAWDEDVIELSQLSESSRKQQIVDMMITLSHPPATNPMTHVGYANLCASRRGTLQRCAYFRDLDGWFHFISDETYGILKAATGYKTYLPDVELYSDCLPGFYEVMDKRRTFLSDMYDGPDENTIYYKPVTELAPVVDRECNNSYPAGIDSAYPVDIDEQEKAYNAFFSDN